MTTPIKNTTSLPEYSLHRIVKDANDPATITEKGHGITTGPFQKVAIQVVPSGGANPTIEVLFWSPEANQFIESHTLITFAGKGADTPYEVIVDAFSRLIFVRVDAGLAASGIAKIFVGGCPNA